MNYLDSDLAVAVIVTGLVYSLVFFFTVGPLLALIYSMLFSGLHQKREIKLHEKRISASMNTMNGDILTTLQKPFTISDVKSCGLVIANVTVAPSWAQALYAWIKSLFGGNINSYTRILRFGRNEVLQKLREQAMLQGWKEVINVRIETANVMVKRRGQNNGSGSLEFVAYGTGIK